MGYAVSGCCFTPPTFRPMNSDEWLRGNFKKLGGRHRVEDPSNPGVFFTDEFAFSDDTDIILRRSYRETGISLGPLGWTGVPERSSVLGWGVYGKLPNNLTRVTFSSGMIDETDGYYPYTVDVVCSLEDGVRLREHLARLEEVQRHVESILGEAR